MARVTKKLVDSNLSIAEGGRAERYWSGRPVKRSSRYSTSRLDFDIDQDDVIKRFSLKGFEYGNWVNNNDRYDRLLATNDSLTELAKIIGSRNIGLDGTVGIAFGARGHSKAAAHFEPHTWMINLTKENGFGALAHEYGHALDYFFGTHIDQSKTSSALSGGSTVIKTLNPSGGEMRRLAVGIVNMLCASASYTRWEKMGEYWIRRNEIFARTFEMWIACQCRQRLISNTFLARTKYESEHYPAKADFMKVLPLINRLMRDMSLFMNNDKRFVAGYDFMKVYEIKQAATKKVSKGKLKTRKIRKTR